MLPDTQDDCIQRSCCLCLSQVWARAVCCCVLQIIRFQVRILFTSVSETVKVCSSAAGWQVVVLLHLPTDSCTRNTLCSYICFSWYKPIQAILSDLHLQLEVPQYLNTDMVPEIAQLFWLMLYSVQTSYWPFGIQID